MNIRKNRRTTLFIPFLIASRNIVVSAAFQTLSRISKNPSSQAIFNTRTVQTDAWWPQGKRLSRPSIDIKSSSATCHRLFFRSGDLSSTRRPKSLKPGLLEQLESPDIKIPIELKFVDDADVDDNGDSDNGFQDKFVIRFMKPDDLSDVLPMCIAEFGTGPTATLEDFPWNDLNKFSSWWDRFYFEPSVTLSLRAKMNANLSKNSKSPQTTTSFNDPVMLVLCRTTQSQAENCQQQEVIGMVELSLQAPEADRNPPAFPVPLWIKRIYCQITGQKLQGWVTNLLVDPKYRGLGLSKILMAATEGIAKSWGCDAIYLHADADTRTGRISQGLYQSLGYEVVSGDNSQYSWMGESFHPFSSIRMIEGVPLLCFCKQLSQ